MRITLVFILLLSYSISAQNYNFGKISKEELEETSNPMDPDAVATYLYKNRNTFYEYNQEKGFQLITEIHERIKIYTSEGFDYATKTINLYKSGSTKEKITNIKAVTYSLEGDKIESIKLKKNGVFKTELSKYYDQTKFTLPNLKPKSIVEYKYRISSPFIQNIDEFQFQHAIPIKKLEARFENPEYFNFKINTKGFLRVSPETTEGYGSIKFLNKSSSQSGFGNKSTNFSYSDVKYQKYEKKYNLTNVPALKLEPYVDNINNYRSAVKFELSYTKFPNSTIDYYTRTWEDVVKTIYESSNFGAELNKTRYFEEDITALIKGVSNPSKKIELIFNYVKSRLKWNGYHSKYTSGGVKKAYKDQVGNVAEINLMLTAMLRYAGLNANPVLVSTRSNGIPLFPTREGYNYIVTAVSLNNEPVLLDATNKFAMPNILPSKALNWKGRIIRKDGKSALINLYPSKKSKTIISMAVNLADEGDINGVIRTVKTGHSAMNYRQSYVPSNKEDYLERMENNYGGMEISDFEVKNDLDLSKPVMESFKFSKENQFEVINNQLYLSPMFFLTTKENPFKSNQRLFPVNFGHPQSNKYTISITIPEGYKVESLPKQKMLKLPQNMGSFKYHIASTPQSIQIVVNAEMNQAIVPSTYYDTLKQYFKTMIEAENEKIVLSK